MARKKKTATTKAATLDAPQSRNEALLQNILGANNALGDPQSRNEALLMNILGESYDIGEPQSRIEQLLMQIKEQGIGGKITADDLGKVVQEIAAGEYGLVAQTAHEEITENGTYDTTVYNEVAVNVPSGSSSLPEKDVNFYDYDGAVVNSYTKAEFLALSEMPANPAHDGLSAQGWNWTFQDARELVSSYGKIDISQMYVTSDGKTRIYITIDDDALLNPYLGINVNGTVDIDWGDGSEHDTLTGTSISTLKTIQHSYNSTGDYVISLSVTGTIRFEGGNNLCRILNFGTSTDIRNSYAPLRMINGIEIGDNCEIGNYAFSTCSKLNRIMIPPGITTLPQYAIYECHFLPFVGLPAGMTSIGRNAFYNDYGLNLVSVPKTMTNFGQTAFSYSGIGRILIPTNVVSIASGSLSDCRNLKDLVFQPTTPPSLGSTITYIFNGCKIYVPQESLTAYTSATNYPNSSTYSYIGY